MRALVYGAGSIYNEFYFPIFNQLKVKVDIIDPRVTAKIVSDNLNYDFVLISSPPEVHFSNFFDVFKRNLSFEFIIVEKPALTSLQDYLFLMEELKKLKINRVYTVTPRRLSVFGKFWEVYGHKVKSLNLIFGVQSKWVLNSNSHLTYNSCAFDLGPHFLDLINNCNFGLKNQVLKVIDKKVDFNSCFISYLIKDTLVNVFLSRKDYLSNTAFCETFDGEKVILSLNNNDGVYTDFNNFDLEFKESNSLNEFIKLLNCESSLLFSNLADFYSTLTILDQLYD